MGYLNENNEWVCEDKCISSDNGKYCGTTDHFTSFAILLDGGNGTGGCDSDNGVNEVIAYLSIAFISLAIFIIVISIFGYEIFFRLRKTYKDDKLTRILTRTKTQMEMTN